MILINLSLLQPDNMLLSGDNEENLVVKLADFGMVSHQFRFVVYLLLGFAFTYLTNFSQAFAKKIGNGSLHAPCGSPVYIGTSFLSFLSYQLIDFYTAPEIIKEESYDKAVDIWSAGVVLYILYVHLCVFPLCIYCSFLG